MVSRAGHSWLSLNAVLEGDLAGSLFNLAFTRRPWAADALAEASGTAWANSTHRQTTECQSHRAWLVHQETPMQHTDIFGFFPVAGFGCTDL